MPTLSPPPKIKLLSTAVISSDATVEFTGLTDSYKRFFIELMNVLPATDNVSLEMRTSSDGGVSFDSGASDYRYQESIFYGSVAGQNVATADSLVLATFVGNAATDRGISGLIDIFNPGEADYTAVNYLGHHGVHTGATYGQKVGGLRLETAVVDAVQLLMSSGNIASGMARLFGVK